MYTHACPAIDHHVVRLCAQAYLFQIIVSGVRAGDVLDEKHGECVCCHDSFTHCAFADSPALCKIVTTLFGDVRQAQQQTATSSTNVNVFTPPTSLQQRCVDGVRGLLQVAALYMHATTRIPPPEALKGELLRARAFGHTATLQIRLSTIYQFSVAIWT
jgi:hypothetical protein